MMLKDGASKTDEEAIRLSKRPSHVPLLGKEMVAVDRELESLSKRNPILVRTRPLELPEHVV